MLAQNELSGFWNAVYSHVYQLKGFESFHLCMPKAYIFTPIYYEARNYGYAVISYGDQARSYDEVYRLWIWSLGCGIESMRRTLFIQAMRERGAAVGIGAKFPMGMVGEAGKNNEISKEEAEQLAYVERILNENLFTYHFQPIVSAVDGKIYAFEALMRARTDPSIRLKKEPCEAPGWNSAWFLL